jgi:beta-glucosidase
MLRISLSAAALVGCGVLLGCGMTAGAVVRPDSGVTAPPAGTAAQASPEARSDGASAGREAQLEKRIGELMRTLTLEQKVAQMVQADIRSVTPEDVRTYRLGSILNGGGAFPGNDKHARLADWVALADRFYDASMDTTGGAPAIPIIWGTDAVHGHNNVIGATIFPHNVALGATHDPGLVQRIGAATAREVTASGIDWTFAPTVAVVRDSRWGRSYEGYSDQPELVRSYAGRMVEGLQGTPGAADFLDGTHIIATAKHYIGDGGTNQGIDRGDTRVSEQDLLAIHGPGYVAAIQAGVQTVMASYSSWQGTKLHGQRHLLTDVLKNQLGFDGFVISDWDGVDEVQGCSKDRCAQAINAGIDMIMVPEQWQAFLQNTVAQVRAGDIPQSRIDDAVTRILRVKLRYGLFAKGRPSSRPLANKAELGSPQHRALAREAVRKSVVLLKNDQCLLPLSPHAHVLVAGDGADDIGKQSGGWTISWQGTGNTNADFPGGTSIFAGIHSAVSTAGGTATLSVDGSYQTRPDVAIVVFGESPYAEWHGDIRSPEYRGPTDDGQDVDLQRPAPEVSAINNDATTSGSQQAMSGLAASSAAPVADLLLLQRLRGAGIPVVAVFLTGRVRQIEPELAAASAFAVAWWPGTEGGGVADVLFRARNGSVKFPFAGRLSYAWPRGSAAGAVQSFPDGYGLGGCNRH